jgi:hypothetical protein
MGVALDRFSDLLAFELVSAGLDLRGESGKDGLL